MKKAIIGLITILFIMGCKSTPAPNPGEVPLDTAIREAAALMETRLDRGTKIALISFTSHSQTFSEYVLDELSSVLVNDGVLTVVDRASLDKVRQELNFNMSGEVSDESAQAIGKMLGAQAIVTGSIVSIGDLRRVMFKTIITETAAVAVQHPADIINDRRVQALLADSGGAQALTYNGQGSGNSGTSTTAAGTQTQSTTPANGTYSFSPRLQAYKGASKDTGAFLWKIVVRGEYMSIYLTNTANGPTREFANEYWRGHLSYPDSYILQDLDNPGRAYNAENIPQRDDEGSYLPFKGVKSKRFSLSRINGDKSVYGIFEEIILGEPDT